MTGFHRHTGPQADETPLPPLALARTLSPRLRSSRDEDLPNVDILEPALEDKASLTRATTYDLIGPPPDGGRDAWLCVASTFLVLFCVFGFVTSMGQLQAIYLENQLREYSKSTVAWIASCQSTLTFLASLFFGRYFDVHGARALVIGGTVLSFGALVGVAFSREYYQFLLSHALFGFAGSLVYSPATAVAAHWFLRRRSTAVGIIVCGAGLGGVVYPIMIKQLCDKLAFRDAILIIAGFNAVLMAPACFWMKTRLPPREPPPWRALRGPWHEARYTFLVIGAAMFQLNIFSPYFYAPIMASANNVRPDIAAYSIAILQAGSFIGRATSGFLADAFGVWRVFGSMGFASSIFVFAFWTASGMGTAPALIGMFLYGWTSGAYITLIAASMAAISPTREIGMRLGMLWSAIAFPLLAGPTVCGELVSAAGNKFTYAGIFCGISLFLGSLLCVAPLLWSRIKGNSTDNQESDAESRTTTVVGDCESKDAKTIL